MGWIKTKEKLPKDGEAVLVAIYGIHSIGFYYHTTKKWWNDDGTRMMSGITHWMELPELPRRPK